MRMGLAQMTNRGGARRAQLSLYAVDIAEDPKLGDLPRVGREEGASSPLYFATCWFNLEKASPVKPLEDHTGGGAVLRDNQIIDRAGEAAQCGMNGAHVIDETLRSAAFWTQRTAKAKMGMQNLSGDVLVSSIPDLEIKPLDQLLWRYAHRAAPLAVIQGPRRYSTVSAMATELVSDAGPSNCGATAPGIVLPKRSLRQGYADSGETSPRRPERHAYYDAQKRDGPSTPSDPQSGHVAGRRTVQTWKTSHCIKPLFSLWRARARRARAAKRDSDQPWK
jgi:hypothetical protein